MFEMFVNIKFSLFSQFMPDCENIICENYNYNSMVINFVLHWARALRLQKLNMQIMHCCQIECIKNP